MRAQIVRRRQTSILSTVQDDYDPEMTLKGTDDADARDAWMPEGTRVCWRES